MNFESYKKNIISEFTDECLNNKLINNKFSKEKIHEINKLLDKHKKCFDDHHKEFSIKKRKLFAVEVYDNGENVTIECKYCKLIIVDTDILLEE